LSEWSAGTPLSREEHDFIDAYEQRRSSGGWHQPDECRVLAPLYEVDAEPSAEDSAILQSLMSVGSQSALEFIRSHSRRLR
jgi:hypothetical protein